MESQYGLLGPCHHSFTKSTENS